MPEIEDHFSKQRLTSVQAKKQQWIEKMVRDGAIDFRGVAAEVSERSRHHFAVGAVTAGRYKRHGQEYVFIIKALYGLENADDCFAADKLIEYTLCYLTTLCKNDKFNRGRISEKFKRASLDERITSLQQHFLKYTPGFASIYLHWEALVRAHIHHLAIECQLGRTKMEKSFYGLEEFSVLFETALSQRHDIAMTKQSIVLWQIALLAGIRPGSVGPVDGDPDGSRYIKWGDIQFPIGEDGELEVLICIKHLKGSADPYGKNATSGKQLPQGLHLRFTRRRSEQYICADLTITLPILAIQRGYLKFRDYAAVEAYTKSPGAMAFLPTDAQMANEPVFRAGREGTEMLEQGPLKARHTAAVLQRIARAAGFGGRLPTLYNFRRGLVTHVTLTRGDDLARQIVGHRKVSESLTYYHQGTVGLDVAEMSLPQGKDLEKDRNSSRRHLTAPALHQIEPDNQKKLADAAERFALESQEYQQAFGKVTGYLNVLEAKYGTKKGAKSLRAAFPDMNGEEEEGMLRLIREKKNVKRVMTKRGRMNYLADTKLRVRSSLTLDDLRRRTAELKKGPRPFYDFTKFKPDVENSEEF
ncbi:hypothetical protein TWF481_001899 [Arthrobotrys musiformis]|uniref:Tyr recombinase domain-containing protein n=1 Tax=Arthrobotrys musiformis TaxID=47236 RepID=A0AAV9VUK8_9PEZI